VAPALASTKILEKYIPAFAFGSVPEAFVLIGRVPGMFGSVWSLAAPMVPRVIDPAEVWADKVPTLIVLGNLVVEIVPDIFETIERVPGMLGSV
jgi:hypothetical protein